MKLKIFLVALALQLLSFTAAQAQSTVYLSVAASMTNAFKEMITDFQKTHSDVQFLPNFGASGSLAKQIENGAPTDIFVSANPKWMKYLVEKDFVSKGTDRIFAYNQLVFVGKKQANDLTLDKITGLARIAIGTPASVPAGQYAKQAMDKAGIYATLEKENKLIMAKDVRQALMYADRGEVDGAFVYRTDALLAQNAQILFTVPQDLYNRVAYPKALTKTGANNQMAKEFYNYMNSSDATAILTKFGFVPNNE